MKRTVGIGTSNKPIGDYIKELKAQGVKVVVDIRGTPRSRFFPHFNKVRTLAFSPRL